MIARAASAPPAVDRARAAAIELLSTIVDFHGSGIVTPFLESILTEVRTTELMRMPRWRKQSAGVAGEPNSFT